MRNLSYEVCNILTVKSQTSLLNFLRSLVYCVYYSNCSKWYIDSKGDDLTAQIHRLICFHKALIRLGNVLSDLQLY